MLKSAHIQKIQWMNVNKTHFKEIFIYINVLLDNFAAQPKKYETYLKSRPASMELDAIKLVTELAVKYKFVLYRTTKPTKNKIIIYNIKKHISVFEPTSFISPHPMPFQ